MLITLASKFSKLKRAELTSKHRTAFDRLVERASIRHFRSEWMDLPRRMMQAVDTDAHLCTITIPERGHILNFGPLMASLPSIAEGNF